MAKIIHAPPIHAEFVRDKQWGRLKSAFRKKNFPFLAVAPDG
jgi:hypothetical protein